MTDIQWICWSAAFVVLVVGLTVGVVLCAPRHRHDWKIATYSTTAIYVGPKGRNDDLPGRFVTDISLICRGCGEPRLKTVEGRWAAKQNLAKETR